MAELEGQSEQLISFDVVIDSEHHATVSIDGELDMSGIDPLAARVDEVLRHGITSLTVDVGGVRFADSSAIALWVRWASAVQEFELREPPPLLRRVIGAMGLTEKLGAAT
ncbi:MAG TPA: STAS domain-containing protein [Solirubrobacteraceae bacterium]|nr:STAS domain-containing protein [Solirubrobacteraceae bacterium]